LRVWAQQTFSNQANSHEYPNRLCRRREAETALSAESWKWSRKMKQALYAATTALAITASAPALRCSGGVARPEVSLVWVRDKGSNTRITVAGGRADDIAPGRANFWFFPEGVGAEGEVTGKAAYDCAGVSVDPLFLPSSVKQSLTDPIVGFTSDALGRAFNELGEELSEPDKVLPLFTEGWAMQALAYVARASRTCKLPRAKPSSGLAPWQLRRAKEMFRADLAENLSLHRVAEACKLSVSHFGRAFKASTGETPHQWLIKMRTEIARDLLARSSTPIIDIACICGFSDQSHFTRVFARAMGTSPGVWRRENKVQPVA
jgi:AraC-like DNA-binding protein